MKRGSIYLILILLQILTITSVLAVTTVNYENEAQELKDLGLFQGSNTGFELERAPKRVESAVMLIRLLGLEETVLNGKYSHPFTDVPSWANNYIGYMYENGLTQGIGNNLFGSSDLTDAKSYTTFVLRSLGYNDGKGDFSWSTALDKAIQVGIINSTEKSSLLSKSFLRDDMVHVSYNALSVLLKDSNLRLIDSLVEKSAVDETTVQEKGLASDDTIYLTIKRGLDNQYIAAKESLPKEILDKTDGFYSFRGNVYSANMSDYQVHSIILRHIDLYQDISFLNADEEWNVYQVSDATIFVLGSNNKTIGYSVVTPLKVGESKKFVFHPFDPLKYSAQIAEEKNNISEMVSNSKVITDGYTYVHEEDSQIEMFFLDPEVLKGLNVKYYSFTGGDSGGIEGMKELLYSFKIHSGTYTLYSNPYSPYYVIWNGYNANNARSLKLFNDNGELIAYIVDLKYQGDLSKLTKLETVYSGDAEETVKKKNIVIEYDVFLDGSKLFHIKGYDVYNTAGQKVGYCNSREYVYLYIPGGEITVSSTGIDGIEIVVK